MRRLKRTVILFLVFFVCLTGCAQKNTNQNPQKDAGGQAGFSNAGAGSMQEPAAGTQARQEPAADTQALPDTAMLLERDFALPDAVGGKETMMSILMDGRQEIEVFSRKGTEKFYQYVFSDGGWEKQELQFPEPVKVSAGLDRAEIIYGEDGRYYVFYALSDESYHLQVTDDLKKFEEITPPEWMEEKDLRYAPIPQRVRVSENGTLCAALMFDDVCRFYDLKNGGSTAGEAACGAYTSMEVCGNFVLNEQGDGKGCYVYDIEKQETALEIEKNLSGNAVYEMRSLDEIYACNENGIYELSAGKWQMLVDSSLNSLSDPDLLRLGIRHAGGQIYIQYILSQSQRDGKNKEGAVMKCYEYSTDIPKVKAEVTIWGLKENVTIRRTLAVFRKKHPDVRVIYETAADAGGAQTTQDTIRQFNAKLYAGDGPDMILLDGMPWEAYREKGLLQDLSGEMAEVEKELLPAVRKLMDENPYAVPLRTAVPVLAAKKEMLADSLEEFLHKNEGKAAEMTAEEIAGVCYNFFSEGIALNQADITKEKLADFLKLCQKASEKWALNDSRMIKFNYEDGGCLLDLLSGNAEFSASYAYGLNQIYELLDVVEQRGLDYRIVEMRFLPLGMLAVNKDSANKELAVEFILEALGSKVQEQDAGIEGKDGFPVNEKALDTWAGRESNTMFAFGGGERETVSIEWPSQEIIKRFLKDVKNADKVTWLNSYVQELVVKAAADVIRGQEDADAAAGKITNQLELYYDE